jgi:hypothetical protein
VISLGTVASRIEAFSESTTKLTGSLTSALTALEQLQCHTLIVTTSDAPLTPDSFVPAAGSAESRLLDALTFRRAIAGVLDQYGKLLVSIGSGDQEGEIEKARQLLDAATRELGAATPDGDTAIVSANEDLTRDVSQAGASAASPTKVKLVKVAEGVQGALGFVSKVAGDSSAGGIAGGIFMASTHIEQAVRQKHGMTFLTTMIPSAQADLEALCRVIVQSEAPLAAASAALVQRILTFNNACRPDKNASGRVPYDFAMASLLQDARQFTKSMTAAAAGVGQLPAAHKAIGQMLADVPTPAEAIHALVNAAEHSLRKRATVK